MLIIRNADQITLGKQELYYSETDDGCCKIVNIILELHRQVTILQNEVDVVSPIKKIMQIKYYGCYNQKLFIFTNFSFCRYRQKTVQQLLALYITLINLIAISRSIKNLNLQEYLKISKMYRLYKYNGIQVKLQIINRKRRTSI